MARNAAFGTVYSAVLRGFSTVLPGYGMDLSGAEDSAVDGLIEAAVAELAADHDAVDSIAHNAARHGRRIAWDRLVLISVLDSRLSVGGAILNCLK